MKAIEILMEEHRVIERVLGAVERQVNKLNEGTFVRPSFFLDVADFVRNYADGAHHMKEEGCLFPAMGASGVATDDGPLQVMLAEHEEGRRLTRAMVAAAERLERGEAEAAGDVARIAMEYVALLREHIQKEDTVVFPMATQAIAPKSMESVTEDIVRIERQESDAGTQKTYLDLARRLEIEAGG